MKKVFYISLLFIAIIIFVKCEENISPLGNYHEQYAVTAQLNIDSSSHVILISKSSPNPFSSDPSELIYKHAPGAEVKLFSDDEVYEFTEVTNDNSSDGIDMNIGGYYSLDGFIPGYNKNLRLSVVTQSGDQLSAYTATTKKQFFDISKSSEMYPPPLDTIDFIQVIWDTTRKELYSYKYFYFTYYRMVDNELKKYEKEIPSDYIETKEGLVPQYFRFNNATGFGAQRDAIERTLLSISEGDNDKASYYIGRIYLEMYQMDESLSRYYSSIGTELDQFSIQIGTNDYTNIDDGFGVFGSYSKNVFIIPILWEYIRSLGYTPYAEG